MAEYLITYDLKKTDPSPYRIFLDECEKEDLLYIYKGSSSLLRLPNSTVWGNFTNKTAARSAFSRAQAAAEKALGRKIILEKRVITKIDDAFFLSDKSKPPEPKWTKSTSLETCRAHQLNDPFF